eukprot:CAMPEP_0175045888 /NCGR_PEP_ID=MMETSP0052_2-20121109/4708_1 /TAXON_ID=51329 ORGANISM="Polytomella parva, Strain SAG 63-3" /NCGR_SAMPLE_ID=MMETSP0052_2 /ASSEMBLY_ACC=CAM_ASM_000194 /LENGTH=205 /DNA_ID=CAMNT_0016309539 /DNA_START=35 /DNA_END=652 /DNA_ORIENTATION=+
MAKPDYDSYHAKKMPMILFNTLRLCIESTSFKVSEARAVFQEHFLRGLIHMNTQHQDTIKFFTKIRDGKLAFPSLDNIYLSELISSTQPPNQRKLERHLETQYGVDYSNQPNRLPQNGSSNRRLNNNTNKRNSSIRNDGKKESLLPKGVTLYDVYMRDKDSYMVESVEPEIESHSVYTAIRPRPAKKIKDKKQSYKDEIDISKLI